MASSKKSSPPPASKAKPDAKPGAKSEPASAPASADAPGSKAPAKVDPAEMQRQILKNLALRLGLPAVALWLLAIFFHTWWAYAGAAVLTTAAAGLVLWAWKRTEKTRQVANILQSVDPTSKEGRKEALEKLSAGNFDKGDMAATLARAQLLMQDDPDKAMEQLETVDLTKVLPAEADQVRFQRALIHLLRGEVDKARALVDLIDLSKQEDVKARAMMGAVVAEAWARTGQAKKGLEILDLYKVDDPTLTELRPQLLRARAFAAAALNDMKEVRRVLKRMAAENPQYLGIFIQKKVHPLLTQEAKILLMQSGAMPRPKQNFRMR